MTTQLTRRTKETQIALELRLDGGAVDVATPVKFLDHMLASLARHGGLGLKVQAASKDKDEHHLVEDVAITLGQALARATEGRALARFGHEVLPMDDALVGAYVDLGGRSYYEGRLPLALYEHFLRSLAHEARLTLHVNVQRGRDEHHVVEAAFKAFARALRQALAPAPETASTKGKVETRGR